jgi:hypothetical protein
VNDSNSNGTDDVGLMQLNSAYFSHIDRFDPLENLKKGCEHLREKYEQYGTWDQAIARYNGYGDMALRHLSYVLMKEREMDRAFNLSDLV